jgi:hypothetical protein
VEGPSLVARRIPYEFLFDHLATVDFSVKPMFGHHAVYVRDRIVLFLIDRPKEPDNGVCLATTAATIPSLCAEFPSLRHLQTYGPDATDWRVLPADAVDFEEAVVKACELISAGDPRIGRTPKSKRPKRT